MQGIAEVSVLSVSEGDAILRVDPEDPASRERFARIITRLLREGYLISVVTGTDAQGQELRARVTAFDEQTLEYIVEGTTPEEEVALQKELGGTPRAAKKRRRIPLAGTQSDAVPPTAGGCAPDLLWTTDAS